MHYLVADIARTITLEPGDLLFSGTPAFSRPVYPGDVVEVEVEGLGTLRNHIVTGPTADPNRCWRPTHRERRSHLHCARRRLGVLGESAPLPRIFTRRLSRELVPLPIESSLVTTIARKDTNDSGHR